LQHLLLVCVYFFIQIEIAIEIEIEREDGCVSDLSIQFKFQNLEMETLLLGYGVTGLKFLNSNPKVGSFRSKSYQFVPSSSNLCHKLLLPTLNYRKGAIHSVASDNHHHHQSHNHDHNHGHCDDDHDHQQHLHHHHHHGEEVQLNKYQEGFIRFAKAVGWLDLANFLRENLQLCCCSMALFLAAAACPYLVPKPVAKSWENAFIFIAFPLVGVILI